MRYASITPNHEKEEEQKKTQKNQKKPLFYEFLHSRMGYKPQWKWPP